MSLKFFHIFFIAASLILSLFFGVWSVREFQATAAVRHLYWGGASFAAFFALAGYLAWFVNKLRRKV
ncbi:MAG: hypothetical protein HY593_04805 [Candidatus Omnitrophica bacterium]|nr:hypothetical protein [Candidatus Omnitrophota bacterium]